jgi:hypothetical protein
MMPEKDDKSEKHSRTSIGTGNTQINRETTSRSEGSSSYDDGTPRDDRYDRDRYATGNRPGYDDEPYDDEPDYQERARRGARDLGESVRDTGRTVRREGTNIITAGCDLIGGIFTGIGEAISPRGRGGSSFGSCGEITTCGGGRGSSYDDSETTYRKRPRGQSGARVSTSRTEIRRTTAR